MSPESPESHLPLTPLSYQVLLALAVRPRHGYGIIKEIEEREGQVTAPSTGALYLALQRMESDGLIGPSDPPAEETDRRRRFYRLTPLGRKVATAESIRLAGLVDAARSRKLIPEEGR